MNGLASELATHVILIGVVLFIDIMTLVEQRRKNIHGVDGLELGLFSKLALVVMNTAAFVAMGRVIYLSCF